MALLGDVSIPAAELYLLRFCVTMSRRQVPVARRIYRPLLDFAQMEWRSNDKMSDYVLVDHGLVSELTSAHFGLIQANSVGFNQLFVWFPPRARPSGDECRLLVRAGLNLNLWYKK